MQVTIDIDDKVRKVLEKRAAKNMTDLKKQIEDIVRRSCVSFYEKDSVNEKCDDKLVSIFSRQNRGRKFKK